MRTTIENNIKGLKKTLRNEELKLTLIDLKSVVLSGNLKRIKKTTISNNYNDKNPRRLVVDVCGFKNSTLKNRYRITVGRVDKLSNLSETELNDYIIMRMRLSWPIWINENYPEIAKELNL